MWSVNGDSISKIYAGTGALEGKAKVSVDLSRRQDPRPPLGEASQQSVFQLTGFRGPAVELCLLTLLSFTLPSVLGLVKRRMVPQVGGGPGTLSYLVRVC